MIPVAIVAGIVLGYRIRLWAVPVVAVTWTLVAVSVGVDGLPAALGLIAANTAVGALFALLLRHLLHTVSSTNA